MTNQEREVQRRISRLTGIPTEGMQKSMAVYLYGAHVRGNSRTHKRYLRQHRLGKFKVGR